MIELKNQYFELGILPELGAGVTYLNGVKNDNTFPLLVEAPEQIVHPDQLAFFCMLPWANNLSEGITVEGDFYSIVTNENSMAMHGNGWFLPWDVLEKSSTGVTLGLDSNELAPFDYSATLDYRLNQNQLEIRLALTHMGDNPVPYGLGVCARFIMSKNRNLKVSNVALNANQLGQPIRFEDYLKEVYIEFPEFESTLLIKNYADYLRFLELIPNQNGFSFMSYSHEKEAHYHSSPKSKGLVWLNNGQTLAMKWCLTLI